MAGDSLRRLLALRLREVDRMRQELADCLASEAAAAGTVRSIDAALALDGDSGDGPADRLRFLDIFLARRQHLRTERLRSAAALAEAEARSAAARGRLMEARLAAEAVDRLVAERTAAARAEADRRAQRELDDAARLRRK